MHSRTGAGDQRLAAARRPATEASITARMPGFSAATSGHMVDSLGASDSSNAPDRLSLMGETYGDGGITPGKMAPMKLAPARLQVNTR